VFLKEEGFTALRRDPVDYSRAFISGLGRGWFV